MRKENIILYQFFYKDAFGKINSKIIEVNKKDNELAIAKFEKENPNITWSSFNLTPKA